MPNDNRAMLKRPAQRYVWWKSPEEAVRAPRRVVAQVMNLGDWDDVVAMRARLGDEALRDALVHAEAGQFNALVDVVALPVETGVRGHGATAAGASLPRSAPKPRTTVTLLHCCGPEATWPRAWAQRARFSVPVSGPAKR